MIAVIFEVWPKAERKQGYLNVAAELKPLLEKVDGFISIERRELETQVQMARNGGIGAKRVGQ